MGGPLEEAICRNVRRCREDANLSQAELADRLNALGLRGWTQAGVAATEKGSRRPRIEDIAGLCAALGRPFADLLKGADSWALEALTGKPTPPSAQAIHQAAVARESRDLSLLAASHLRRRGLGEVSVDGLVNWAQSRYGHSLFEIRERAAQQLVTSGFSPNLTKARSTATRDVLARIAHDYPESEGMSDE